ncbi:peroxisomal membrane protein 2 [Callorhinchus milii]|uniref:Peroxisomal membrane protein 2 n=1 Tax=Callorhinchus milii TaxID=7868 RepID=A0A4W3JDS9_CALMI|nr:peroxisomal membrane protein 2 [Callorhinchus milii]|eukprot:gi/632967665/ref/XP_007900103.1/ PREDICTED: peroxisomal membrane protein 2 [Callorhinchus milii]
MMAGHTAPGRSFDRLLLQQYLLLLKKYPIPTKSVTSGILSGFGNILSQVIERRGKQPNTGTSLDIGGPIRFGVFGLVFTGPLSHFFYQFLDKYIPSNVAFSQIKRLLVDRLVFAPAFLALFFFVISMLEGKKMKALKDKMQTSYWIALKMNWKVWTIFQYININYVPPQFRVLFANLVALFWYAYLASIRR